MIIPVYLEDRSSDFVPDMHPRWIGNAKTVEIHNVAEDIKLERNNFIFQIPEKKYEAYLIDFRFLEGLYLQNEGFRKNRVIKIRRCGFSTKRRKQ